MTNLKTKWPLKFRISLVFLNFNRSILRKFSDFWGNTEWWSMISRYADLGRDKLKLSDATHDDLPLLWSFPWLLSHFDPFTQHNSPSLSGFPRLFLPSEQNDKSAKSNLFITGIEFSQSSWLSEENLCFKIPKCF